MNFFFNGHKNYTIYEVPITGGTIELKSDKIMSVQKPIYCTHCGTKVNLKPRYVFEQDYWVLTSPNNTWFIYHDLCKDFVEKCWSDSHIMPKYIAAKKVENSIKGTGKLAPQAK